MEQPTIDFQTSGKKLFTPTFFKVRKANTRFVVVYGGASSGKSYSVHQHELIEIMKPGKGNTLVMRKHGTDMRESCYALFLKLIQKYGLQNYFKCTYGNDQRKITCLASGRSLLFKGIDDPEKLKSIVDIKRIILEEASQFEFDDFLELNRRARGLEGIQIILILNPISENHWIKTKLCDVSGEYFQDTTLIRATYQDNKNMDGKSFLTEMDVKELERLKTISENHYRIYVLGEWGIDNKESKFCWAFNRDQIKKTEHDESIITWASFDFNVNPMSCIIAQVIPEETILRAIECIKLENSDVWKMCDRLLAYPANTMWMITGDASGANRSAVMEDNRNAYMIIREKLMIMNEQIKVPLSNPSQVDNRLLVNAVHKNWTVEIDPDKCKPLIFDLQYVEVDDKGKILKGEDRGGSETIGNLKKYSDQTDCWRYLINIAILPHMNWHTY